jgi:hypothetical protein
MSTNIPGRVSIAQCNRLHLITSLVKGQTFEWPAANNTCEKQYQQRYMGLVLVTPHTLDTLKTY